MEYLIKVVQASKTRRLILFLLLVAVYLFAWQMQETLFLNYDVSWLMHAVRRLLAGGSYSRDFFETNPPLILYLYLPPVLLAKATGLPAALLFRGYVFALATMSLGLCAIFVRRIFEPEKTVLAAAFYITLALVFLLLPCLDFGQRDHLLVILSLPYLLLVVSRLQGKIFHPGFAVALGVLAGLGFSIKPHFLLTPLLIEIYCVFSKKSARAWLRPETLALLATVAVYAGSIFLFFPDYLYVVVPYSLRLYYSGVSQPWSELLLNSGAVYCAFPLLFYLLQGKDRPERALTSVLALALLGFLVAYFSQRMIHYYHLIPSLSLALLLLVVEFGSAASSLPRRWPERLLAATVGLLLLSIPLCIYYSLYVSSQGYKKQTLNPLAAFINTHARQDAVYFLVTNASFAFPTVDYTEARVAPRFYFLWMAAGLANQSLTVLSPSAADQHRRDKNFLINMVSDDLYQYQPRYVFVDLSEKKYRIKDKHFDYLVYFSENPKFRQQWRNYHYYTTLEEKGAYKLGVYKRGKFSQGLT